MEVSILSWNIMHGGGSRIGSILQSIAKLSPTFLIFSEFRNNKSGDNIKQGLINLGFPYLYYEEKASDDNKVLIASKAEGIAINLNHDCDQIYHPCIKAVDFGVFTLVGAYMPHKKKHNLFQLIKNLTNEKHNLILAGDLNTGINYVDQLGNSFWYEDDLKSMIKDGMVDAFRLKNGDVKEYSWYSHQGNGFRYDHTFVQEGLTPYIKQCEYLHKYRENRISDHSPMILTFGI